MKKRIIALAVGVITCMSALTSQVVFADGSAVVSVGADLTKEQREKIFEYFGVKETELAVIEVNNKEEREYLEGVATEQQIGRRTYSCAFIEETEEGNGINVKTANLTWVTSNMIKSTLTTAGIYDCNVVAAAPFAVSGTGALTGILKAFEIVTGEELEESKKEIATEEIVVSGNLAEDIGSDEAVGIMTDVKNTIIGENIIVADDIEQVIIDASNKYEVALTDDQVQMILGTMQKISEQEYDYNRLESTFNSIIENTSDKLGIELETAAKGTFEKIMDWFRSVFEWFKNLFSNKDADTGTNVDNGILDQTDESILGDDVVVDSTVEGSENDEEETPTAEPTPGQELEVTAEPTQTPEIAQEPATPDSQSGNTVTPQETESPSDAISPEPTEEVVVAPTEEPTHAPEVEPTEEPEGLDTPVSNDTQG